MQNEELSIVQCRKNAKRTVAKAMNDKAMEEATKIEKISAQDKMKYIFQMAIKCKCIEQVRYL